ncbi:Homeobox protein HD-8 [Nosema granulosis]|uniref:Homeobox protein HD-8 n=1 Tax=Nosema granulosis TaxID=83296 RepID=A0A9P6H339_9MICR|nr:Homeobox protein HD-8 [Nosema granulosis]
MIQDINRQELTIQAALGLVKLSKEGKEDECEFMRNKKTDFQNTVLKDVFDLTMYPSSQTKMDLSIMLDLSTRTIQIWFQNERRNRKEQMASNPSKINTEKFEVSALILWRIYEKAKMKSKK